MKKLLSLTVLLSFMACDNQIDRDTGVSGQEEPLITGNTEQAGVNYITDLTNVSFEQVSQDGDSTFYEASFDLNGGSSDDIVFELVKWTDTQILTAKTQNGFFIPFAGSDHEVFSAGVSIPVVTLVSAGVSLELISDEYRTNENLFFAQELNGSTLSAGIDIWENINYLPFLFQGIGEGWVGLSIEAGTGNDVIGIKIHTIAVR